MELNDFLARHSSGMNEAERLFVQAVFHPVLGERGLDFLKPQSPFTDSQEKHRRIDFAVETDFRKYAIEIDGYTYHAEGQVTREKFSDDLLRENDLKIAGWFVLRFAYDALVQNPEACMDQLRRAIAPDDTLNPLFKTQDISPHLPQQMALDAFEKSLAAGNQKGLIVLATGLGKTLLAAFIAKRIGGRVLFLAHREEILDQAMRDFTRVFPNHSRALHKAEHFGCDEDLIFATVQTLSQEYRLKSFASDHFDLVVVDESHHAAADSYRQIIEHLRPQFLLGLTATPYRMDDQEILPLYGDNLIFEMPLQDGVRHGFLIPFKYWGLYDDVDYSNIHFDGHSYRVEDLDKVLLVDSRDQAVIKEFKERVGGKKAIGFCVSKKHAFRCEEKFNAAGIKSVAIVSGETPMEVRRRYVQEFREGKIQVVFVRDIFNEGVDVPDVEALLFLRPTESKTIFYQQLGRGLRISPRKESVTVLDFVGNDENALNREQWIGSLLEVSDSDRTKKRKREFDWDNNGNEVHFDAKTIELFTQMEETNTKSALLDVMEADFETHAISLFKKYDAQRKHESSAEAKATGMTNLEPEGRDAFDSLVVEFHGLRKQVVQKYVLGTKFQATDFESMLGLRFVRRRAWRQVKDIRNEKYAATISLVCILFEKNGENWVNLFGPRFKGYSRTTVPLRSTINKAVECMIILTRPNRNSHLPPHCYGWSGRVAKLIISLLNQPNQEQAEKELARLKARITLTSSGRYEIEEKYGITLLQWAVERGDIEEAEFILSMGTRDGLNAHLKPHGWTLLHLATQLGNKEMVEFLLSHGAVVSPLAHNGETPLHVAVQYGKKEIIEVLLSRGANVNDASRNGETPLHLAVGESSQEIVELLIAKGANIRALDRYGWTPLNVATSIHRDEIVKVLVRRGANETDIGRP